VGYIPVAEPYDIARALNIPTGDAACDVLAARRIETLDMGRIADRYFLTEAVIKDTTASVDVGGAFRLCPAPMGTISIRNLGLPTSDDEPANAKDGWLELSIEPAAPQERGGWMPFQRTQKTANVTRLLMTKGNVESKEPVDVTVDGQTLNGFGFSVSIIPRKFSIVTGRKKRPKPVSGVLPHSERSDMLTPAQ